MHASLFILATIPDRLRSVITAHWVGLLSIATVTTITLASRAHPRRHHTRTGRR